MMKIGPRAATAAAAVTLAALVLSVPANARPLYGHSQNVEASHRHFVTCLDYLINNPAAHKRYCTPNNIVVPMTGLSIPFSSPDGPVKKPCNRDGWWDT